MLSRVADSIYWMHRYIERAESYARFLTVNFNLALDLPPSMQEQWEPLLIITNDRDAYRLHYEKSDKAHVIDFMTFDSRNPNSILSSLNFARENARTVRENISVEMWEQVNKMYLMMKESSLGSDALREDPRGFYKEIINGCQLFMGITASTISRTDAWHFGRMGTFLERADKTSRLLDVKYHILLPTAGEVGTPIDLIQWAALLKSVSAYSIYRKEYGPITPGQVIEFLVLGRNFPRSIFFCVNTSLESLKEVSGVANGRKYNQAEKLLGAMRSKVEYREISEIIETGVHEYLDVIQVEINQVSNAIFDTFISPSFH
ncbi:MAG: alpha-E domain-containing protein [Bacteroidia bacterium]|nr:alpha-E domain-containing protein [Bacteroidia bacterium]